MPTVAPLRLSRPQILAYRRSAQALGTWRRANAVVSVEPWRRLSPEERTAVEAEAASLPLPGLKVAVVVRWLDG